MGGRRQKQIEKGIHGWLGKRQKEGQRHHVLQDRRPIRRTLVWRQATRLRQNDLCQWRRLRRNVVTRQEEWLRCPNKKDRRPFLRQLGQWHEIRTRVLLLLLKESNIRWIVGGRQTQDRSVLRSRRSNNKKAWTRKAFYRPVPPSITETHWSRRSNRCSWTLNVNGQKIPIMLSSQIYSHRRTVQPGRTDGVGKRVQFCNERVRIY